MNALALRPSPLPVKRSGSGTAIQTASGGVSAFFALEAFDPRLGMAVYSLQVVNYTAATLICRVWAIARSGEATLAYPVFVEVLPGTTVETEIPLLPAALPPFERAIVEVAGQGVHCLVEAPPPVRKSRRRYFAAAGVAAALLMITIAGVVRAAMPEIDAFALPPQALDGTTVRAEYHASGAGDLSYSIEAPNGSTFQSGSLRDRTGSIPIAVPASAQGAYTVQIAMTGPLGRVKESRVLNTLAQPTRGGAQIASFSVHPMVARPGEQVTVSYAAVGDRGYLRLIGNDGTVWADRPYSHRGQSQFVVPPVAAGSQLQIVLRVSDRASSAQSVTGLAVAEAAPRPIAQAPQIVGDDDPNAAPASTNDANGTFDVLTKTVRGGGTIRVKIFSPRNAMRLSLIDAQSRELRTLDLAADATTATLRAPAVQEATRYTVEASFADGFGQETVLQPVFVVP